MSLSLFSRTKAFKIFTPIVSTNQIISREYVLKAQKDLLKKVEKQTETRIDGEKLTSLVSLDTQALLREDPLISQFTNTIMRDGKKLIAQKQVRGMLLNIKEETNSDPYKIFSDAIEFASPLMSTRSGKQGSKIIHIPQPLNLRQRRRYAIKWIIEESKKRKEKQFHLRLSNEILAIINHTSNVLNKKLDLHKLVLANKAQIRIPFSR
ncbi:hypothetical protein BB560_000442 [Smittium megazygosporum]|uniref:Small ribosomal subunit protein uS7 domain-containing protein n=1 Tax=Smittium megazygosporum TaxID=133381 RepID=A0A2T9ZKD3_9FUNG|nr:hypothetical protein BB560_000442 [Smittium megazygosporum]